jgi:hypothetical protein
MMNFKKSDLLFISKLDIAVTLIAKPVSNSFSSKKSWYLEIRTEKESTIENGVLIGARGEIREFCYATNIMLHACDRNTDPLRLKFFISFVTLLVKFRREFFPIRFAL